MMTISGNLNALVGSIISYADGKWALAIIHNPIRAVIDLNAPVYVADSKNHSKNDFFNRPCDYSCAGSVNASYVDGMGTSAS